MLNLGFSKLIQGKNIRNFEKSLELCILHFPNTRKKQKENKSRPKNRAAQFFCLVFAAQNVANGKVVGAIYC